MELKHKIIIGVLVLAVVVVIIIAATRERFTNTDQGGPFALDGLMMNYGSVPSNPDSANGKTWAEYEQLRDIPDHSIPYDDVLPGMLHLPPLRDIYNNPVPTQKIDPISGIPESMYTSPRVALTDFQSETTRNYNIYN